jgi:MoaA/NifB/PqqE/SkfB family radical SAM enzyme
MSTSLYWDDFARRTEETYVAIKLGEAPPVRRVAVFITDKCNFKCKYCNHVTNPGTLTQEQFEKVVAQYGDTAIIHITGGEPSAVPWLYPYLKANGSKYRFHLNTNAYVTPPSKSVRRLKISLDSHKEDYWNALVGRKAFSKVVANIKEASKNTVVSLTYTLSKQNYKDAVDFVKFANVEFPDLYAVFFSVYKGTNPDFLMSYDDAGDFFNNVLPELEKVMLPESLALIKETIDEKRRLIQGVRFPQNWDNPTCYLSMSERVISPTGEEYTCSHLYRDRILTKAPVKHKECLYGCNRRLVMFNERIIELLGGKND